MKTNLLNAMLIMLSVFSFISCTKNEEDEVLAQKQQIVSSYDYTNDETQLVDLINNYRVAHGKNALEVVNHISYKSQEHNTYMISNNVVNHDLFDERSTNIIQVLGAKKVGENIAYNFTSSNGAFQAWLLSPGHKENIDGDYTHIGISITINPVNGKKYYTNMFMKK
jgi:uncharacterized protein YkwD